MGEWRTHPLHSHSSSVCPQAGQSVQRTPYSQLRFPSLQGNLSNAWRSVGSSIVLVLYDELQKIAKKSQAKGQL